MSTRLPVATKDIIMMLSDNIELLLKQLVISNTRPFLIGIDGRPCSGKSTLADKLTEILNAEALFLDDFFIPEEYWPKNIKPGFPFPYFYYDVLLQSIKNLAQGKSAQYHPYDWAAKQPAKLRTVNPPKIIIVEGVSVLSEELAPLLNRRIFVVSNISTEFAAISEREKQQGLSNWKNLYLPSVDIYMKSKPWLRADILYAGRDIESREYINSQLAGH